MPLVVPDQCPCRFAEHTGRLRPVAPKIPWRSVRSLAFFEALCHFVRDFLRGFSSRIVLDRCESGVNLIVHRERSRQTAAWKKSGHLEMGVPSAIRMASLVFWLFGGEFLQEEHRPERDGKIPPPLRTAPFGGSQPWWGQSWPVCPRRARKCSKARDFKDCANRFARPGSQNQPSELRPV